MKALCKQNIAVYLMAGLSMALSAVARGEALRAASAEPLSATAKAQAEPAANVEALMKKSDCFTCHSVKRKVVGPAYRDVARKYKGDKLAVVKLVKKVKEGGSGNWGQVPMAAHPDIKDEDLRAMVQWVLKQK